MKLKNFILVALTVMAVISMTSCSSDQKKEDTPVVKAFGTGVACSEGDCLNGKGKIKFPKGEEYNGEFKNATVSGNGVMLWPNGAKYDGNYDNNKRNGKGVFTYSNGDVFNGEYKDNKRNGTGEYKWKNGDIYTGNWKDGKMDGNGTYTWLAELSIRRVERR